MYPASAAAADHDKYLYQVKVAAAAQQVDDLHLVLTPLHAKDLIKFTVVFISLSCLS